MKLESKLSSSVLKSATFEAETSSLQIYFWTGQAYRYVGTDLQLYERLITAQSSGRFYNAFIRGRFEEIPIDS